MPAGVGRLAESPQSLLDPESEGRRLALARDQVLGFGGGAHARARELATRAGRRSQRRQRGRGTHGSPCSTSISTRVTVPTFIETSALRAATACCLRGAAGTTNAAADARDSKSTRARISLSTLWTPRRSKELRPQDCARFFIYKKDTGETHKRTEEGH